MKSIVSVVPKALTIDLDAADLYGNEFVTSTLMQQILKVNHGYVDGDRRQLVVVCKK